MKNLQSTFDNPQSAICNLQSSISVLVVDDEQDLLELIAYNLRREGFRVELAATGKDAIRKARLLLPHLIILDLMLPDFSGFEVCQILRSNSDTNFIPIIMLTAKGEERDRITGLEMGADDYVTKPFSPRELILRVKAVLKRTGGFTPLKTFQIGTLSISPSKHEVLVEDEAIKLTSIEFKLLIELLIESGTVKSRHLLLERVWGYSALDVETRTVDTHIKRLREKLGQAGHYIKTVRGAGYKMEVSEES